MRSPYSIFFSTLGLCTHIKGTSITETFRAIHRSPMIIRPERICTRRMVLSLGLWDRNLAILRRRGFIGNERKDNKAQSRKQDSLSLLKTHKTQENLYLFFTKNPYTFSTFLNSFFMKKLFIAIVVVLAL